MNCARCGSKVKAGRCTNITCIFSDHQQDCMVGWSGHPDKDPFPNEDGIGPCSVCTCPGRAQPITQQMRDTLEIARVQLRDLHMHYSHKELTEPLPVTINRITEVLGDQYDIATSEVSERQ